MPIASNRLRFAAIAALAAALIIAIPAPALAQASGAAPAKPAVSLSSGSDAAKVLATYAGINAQAEITSPSGRHVYIDIYRPSALTTKPGPEDILCFTHAHFDHRNAPFQNSFPGRVIDHTAGETVSGDLRVLGILSAHMNGDRIEPGYASNVLYLVETGGLRILHTGDIGQLAYSEEQLKSFGARIDLLFQQFDNSYSAMDGGNAFGFTLLDQLKPRLVIPTHTAPWATRKQLADYPSLFSESATVELSASALPAETTVLFTGLRAADAWKLFGERGYKR